MSHCLGSGSFATVHLAFDPMNHKQVACKSIKTKRDHEIKTVMKEVRILMTLKHVGPVVFLTALGNGGFTTDLAEHQRNPRYRGKRWIHVGNFFELSLRYVLADIMILLLQVISSCSCARAETSSPTSRPRARETITCVRLRPSISCSNFSRPWSICTLDTLHIEVRQ